MRELRLHTIFVLLLLVEILTSVDTRAMYELRGAVLDKMVETPIHDDLVQANVKTYRDITNYKEVHVRQTTHRRSMLQLFRGAASLPIRPAPCVMRLAADDLPLIALQMLDWVGGPFIDALTRSDQTPAGSIMSQNRLVGGWD